MTVLSPTITLNNGVEMPQLGLGVWQVADDVAQSIVEHALSEGYRAIDTAKIYDNESGVGRALASTGVARSDIFVTTKLWNSDQGRATTVDAFDASLDRLGVDYVDLYLIHWPRPKAGLFVETWEVCEEIYASGRARAIGVSNFEPEHLEQLAHAGLTVPAVNQIECHPRLQQKVNREYHRAHGIVTTAWSPLGQGTVLEDSVLTSIANSHAKSVAQVIIRWHIQLGNTVIPKSVTPARVTENFAVFDFELSDSEMAQIADLDSDGRMGPHPNLADF